MRRYLLLLIGLKSRLRYMSDRNYLFLMFFQSLLLVICFYYYLPSIEFFIAKYHGKILSSIYK